MMIDTNTAKPPETCGTISSSEEVNVSNFLYARAIHITRSHQMNLEIQNECQDLIKGYQELVHLDSSLIPLESL